jgi:hypothetical protein
LTTARLQSGRAGEAMGSQADGVREHRCGC